MKVVTTGMPSAPGEPRHLVLHAVAADLDVHHQHGRRGSAQAGDHLVGAFSQRVRIGRPARQAPAPRSTSAPTRSRGSSI